MAPLVKEAIGEAQNLIQQQFDVIRRELREEFKKGRDAAMDLGVGAGMTAVSGILLGIALVHVVHRTTGLPF